MTLSDLLSVKAANLCAVCTPALVRQRSSGKSVATVCRLCGSVKSYPGCDSGCRRMLSHADEYEVVDQMAAKAVTEVG